MKISTDQDQIQELLTRGVEEIFETKTIKDRLFSGNQLRIKLGIDPTGKKIHIGRATQLWKLRDFQKLGHKIVLIIGDFTATIGDASDKDAMRPVLSKKEVEENMSGYLEQIGKILDMSEVEICYNSQWSDKLSVRDLLGLAQKYTAQQMIQRRNFKERWDNEKPIGLHELFYPIFQGYDSVAIKSDIEIGGSDQLFNLQAGRFIQSQSRQKPQDIMTLKMIWGLDGRKMSTSWGNTVNITDEPNDMFGKIMSLKDEFICDYLETCTRYPMDKVKEIENQIKKQTINPRDAKIILAKEIVSLYYNKEVADNAALEFEKVFTNKEKPTNIPEVSVSDAKVKIIDLLVQVGLAESNSIARRLIEQGGVKIDDNIVSDWKTEVSPQSGQIIQCGKRNFVKIK